MTDRPDRQDGDGLRDKLIEFDRFLNEPPAFEDKTMVRDYRHAVYAKWSPLLNDILANAASTNGAERAGSHLPPCMMPDGGDCCPHYDLANEQARLGFALAREVKASFALFEPLARREMGNSNFSAIVTACAAVLSGPYMPGAAPPQPAPDAMRDALKSLQMEDGLEIRTADSARLRSAKIACLEALSAPVPSPDGAGLPPINETLHTPDIIETLQRRALSPSGTGAAEPVAFDPTNHHNALKCPYCNPQGLSFAAPPVRGDREAIARLRYDPDEPLTLRDVLLTGFGSYSLTYPDKATDAMIDALACSLSLPSAPVSTPETTISACAPETIIAGIAHFGLAPDGSDLRDLLASIVRLRAAPVSGRDAVIEALKATKRELSWCVGQLMQNGYTFTTTGKVNMALKEADDALKESET